MKLNTILIFFLLSMSAIGAECQNATLLGRVVDGTTSEPMINATVRLMADSTVKGGAFTDLEGNYTISNVVPGKYNLVISYVTYENKVLSDIEVKAGENHLEEATLEIDMGNAEKNTVLITSKLVRNTDASVLNIQRKSVNVMDGISSQQFKRTGDANAAGAISRVVGLSVEDGKYVYVRGLGDRYSKTLLNGAEIPGLDPNRNSVQMDMFPTNLIDNIQVFKTFTPDLPGSFSGGLVKISTKDFPESFTFKYSSTMSVNTQSSFRNDFLTGEKGKLDWLGFDDGTRALPSQVASGVPSVHFSNGDAAAEIDAASKSFSTSMQPTTGKSLFDHSHSISVGNQYAIGKNKRPFGFIASLSYRSQNKFYDDGVASRWKLTNDIYNTEDLDMLLDFRETNASQEVLWGGLVNLSYKPWENHSFSMNYLRNQSGKSSARYLTGALPDDDPNLVFETRTVGYQQRSLDVVQLKGEHTFPGAKDLKADWIASSAFSKQNEPDLRFFSNDYVEVEGSRIYDIQRALYAAPSRYYRDMKETNIDFKGNAELPFLQWIGLDAKAKAGVSFTKKMRQFHENRYEYSTGVAYDGDPDAFFAEENMGVIDTAVSGNGQTSSFVYGNYLSDASELRNNYTGDQMIMAAYGMVELPIVEKFKVIAGARFEGTQITVKSEDPMVLPGRISKNDILPSVNLIYSPLTKMNVRGSYSRTIARPTFRELAPFASFEFVRDFVLIGNPNLERTLIDNVDLRWEFYPSAKEIISVSGFYKHFSNPIERVVNPKAGNLELNYRNVAQAQLLGVEVEMRKSLGFIWSGLKDFRVGANASLIKSFLTIDEEELALIHTLNPEAPATRGMFGQSPFTVNAELGYQNDSLGLSASLNFNVFGPRISVVSTAGTPDVYEQSRPSLDLFIAKKLAKKLTVTFRARNLINPHYKQTHTFKQKEYIYQSFTVGRSFSLGLTLDLF